MLAAAAAFVVVVVVVVVTIISTIRDLDPWVENCYYVRSSYTLTQRSKGSNSFPNTYYACLSASKKFQETLPSQYDNPDFHGQRYITP